MYPGLNLKPPLFEVGLKGFMYGQAACRLARAADRISEQYDVQIIFAPQYTDIPRIARETERLLVFAQHMDCLEIGRGQGHVLPEALKEAGAVGVILNHAERRITLSDISRAVRRADQVGLATIVCADTPEEASAVAQLGPNVVLAEPPELIGTGRSVGREMAKFVSQSIEAIKGVNPEIIAFIGAGIRTGEDVAEVIRMGAEVTGCTSAIVKAEDPIGTLQEMIRCLKEAWLVSHP